MRASHIIISPSLISFYVTRTKQLLLLKAKVDFPEPLAIDLVFPEWSIWIMHLCPQGFISLHLSWANHLQCRYKNKFIKEQFIYSFRHRCIMKVAVLASLINHMTYGILYYTISLMYLTAKWVNDYYSKENAA